MRSYVSSEGNEIDYSEEKRNRIGIIPYLPPQSVAPYIDAKNASSGSGTTRRRWAAIRHVEFFYKKALTKVASTVGQFVGDLWRSGRRNQIQETLNQYSVILEPWAESAANKMIYDIAAGDLKAWMHFAGKKARAIGEDLKNAPLINTTVQELRQRQVELIKSIPLDAAQRVQNLAFESVTATGERWDVIAKQIANSENVTIGRAKLIARTETQRSLAIIQEVRAKHIGSDGYIWHTQRDRKVREDHRELEGQYVKWSDPPVADKRANIRAHAGCIYNCRCYAVPIIPSRYQSISRQ